MKLYHKTATENIPSIMQNGLESGHEICGIGNPDNYCEKLGEVYSKFDQYKDNHKKFRDLPYRSDALFFFMVDPIAEEGKTKLVVEYDAIKKSPSECECYAGNKDFVDNVYRDIDDEYYEFVDENIAAYFNGIKKLDDLDMENEDLYDYEAICACKAPIPPDLIKITK